MAQSSFPADFACKSYKYQLCFDDVVSWILPSTLYHLLFRGTNCEMFRDVRALTHLDEPDTLFVQSANDGRVDLHIVTLFLGPRTLLGNIRCLADNRSGFMSYITRDKSV